jgi:hypothetical protein
VYVTSRKLTCCVVFYLVNLMKSMKLLLVIGACAAGAAWAQSVTVRGAGTGRCADYIEMRGLNNASDTYQVGAWVQGFLSGHNAYAGGRNLAVLDVGSTLVELDRFCQANREKAISDGAIAIAERLGAAKRAVR